MCWAQHLDALYKWSKIEIATIKTYPGKDVEGLAAYCPSINPNFKRNYIPTIFLTVFAVLIVSFLLILVLAVFDHQFVF